MNSDIQTIVARQRDYFMTGETRPFSFRRRALRTLYRAVCENEALINDALKADLNKSAFETYMTETGIVLEEISYHLRHLRRWMKNRRIHTPIAQFHSRSYIAPEPYGVSLIMSPWNYPIQLCLSPVVGAISGGNCAVIKPSAYASATSSAIATIIGDAFPSEYLKVVEGGRQENNRLLEEKFDYIFFTGSVAVGKVVMEAASKHLTPVTLELGGKSPAIVDETANIPVAARRIAFGKVLNAGQTCVEPDYLFVHRSVEDRFISEFKRALDEFFPDGDMTTMPTIVSSKHFERLKGLLAETKIAIGGGMDDERRFIEPTVLTDVVFDAPVMQEEIFGPILPIIPYDDLNECISYITSHPRPLALYLFTERRDREKQILERCSFGGGCINDTIIHLANPELPFGGVGDSGMGSYHGKRSFDTFTHYRSIVRKSTWIDLPMRYHPYKERNLRIIRRLLK